MSLNGTRVGAAMLASSAVWLLSSAAAGATVTNGTERLDIPTPYLVKVAAPGIPKPDQGVFRGTGFPRGSMVYVQLCDGAAPTTTGYTPAAHCDQANAGTLVGAAGAFAIDTALPSFQFAGPYHGAGQQSLFNCLAPGDAPDGPFTAVGHQPVNPELPSWGSNRGGSKQGGGSAPCQLRFSSSPIQYRPTDVYVPLAGLGSAADAPGTSSVGAAEVVGPVAGVLALGAVVALLSRRRRSRVPS